MSYEITSLNGVPLPARFLVNFKTSVSYFGNDMLPATINSRGDGKLSIYWDNKWHAIVPFNHVNIGKTL
jgi:hypothetical protein